VQAHSSDPKADERLKAIKHIVILMMENRSFDQMLGYLKFSGMPDLEGLEPEDARDLNKDAEGNVYPIRRCDTTEPLEKFFDPCHSPGCVMEQIAGGAMSGFVKNFIATVNARTERGEGELPPELRDLVMRYYDGFHLPVYDHLARTYCVCDAWHSSVPGDTWLNRVYSIAGRWAEPTGPGIREILRKYVPFIGKKLAGFPVYSAESFTRHLKDDQWRWYSHDPATLRAVDSGYRRFGGMRERFRAVNVDNFAYFDRRKVSFVTETLEEGIVARDSFLDDAARPGEQGLRQVSWIDPNFIDLHVLDPDSNDDHPPSDVRAGQAFVLELYEALYKSRAWEDTLLVIVYDEHGGFYDHMAPPSVSDDPHFKTLGVRVPAIVIGPRVKKFICKETFDHTSLIKTILTRFHPNPPAALAKFPPRVAQAPHLGITLADEPRSDLPTPDDFFALREVVDKLLVEKRRRLRATPKGEAVAADGVGRKQELQDFQREFARFAAGMRDRGLPPGQP
jgi:phospholipase C